MPSLLLFCLDSCCWQYSGGSPPTQLCRVSPYQSTEGKQTHGTAHAGGMARLGSHCWELGIPECFDGDTSRRCKCHCRLTTVPVYACRRQNPVYKQESKTNTHTTIIAGTAASSQLVLLTQPGGRGGFACSEDKRESPNKQQRGTSNVCTVYVKTKARNNTSIRYYSTTSRRLFFYRSDCLRIVNSGSEIWDPDSLWGFRPRGAQRTVHTRSSGCKA
jgi:hypothetical protein